MHLFAWLFRLKDGATRVQNARNDMRGNAGSTARRGLAVEARNADWPTS